MKKTNILSLIFLLTILCGFNSCVDKPFDHIDDPEYILCNGAGWYDDYYDVDGLYANKDLFSIPMAEGKKESYVISAITLVISKNLNINSIGNGMMITLILFIWNMTMGTIFTLTNYIYIMTNYPVI